MKVKRFADSNSRPITHWTEDAEGNRNETDECTIMSLWHKWSASKGCTREDNEEFTIFAFSEEIEY